MFDGLTVVVGMSTKDKKTNLTSSTVAFSSVCSVVVGNAVVDVVVVVVGMFTTTEYFCEICAPWPLSPPLDTNNINI